MYVHEAIPAARGVGMCLSTSITVLVTCTYVVMVVVIIYGMHI